MTGNKPTLKISLIINSFNNERFRLYDAEVSVTMRETMTLIKKIYFDSSVPL